MKFTSTPHQSFRGFSTRVDKKKTRAQNHASYAGYKLWRSSGGPKGRQAEHHTMASGISRGRVRRTTTTTTTTESRKVAAILQLSGNT